MTARPGPKPGTPAPNWRPPPTWGEPRPTHREQIEAEVLASGDTMDDARVELRFELEDLRPLHDWVNVFSRGGGQFALPCPALAVLRASTRWLFAIRDDGDRQFGLEKLDHPLYRIAFTYSTFEGEVLPIPQAQAYIGCTRDEAFGGHSYIGSTSRTEWLAAQHNWTPPDHGC